MDDLVTININGDFDSMMIMHIDLVALCMDIISYKNAFNTLVINLELELLLHINIH